MLSKTFGCAVLIVSPKMGIKTFENPFVLFTSLK